ncbi:MAG: hypothetical protein AMXMBFR59_40730 [Rhodanobacteraceae bacterium]
MAGVIGKINRWACRFPAEWQCELLLSKAFAPANAIADQHSSFKLPDYAVTFKKEKKRFGATIPSLTHGNALIEPGAVRDFGAPQSGAEI